MQKTVQSKLNFWASQYPESFHPLDYQRFYDFVIESFNKNYRISTSSIGEALRQHNKHTIKLEEHYGNLYYHLYSFLEYSQGK